MKSSNKLLVIFTTTIALSAYISASIVYADSSDKQESTGHSLFSFKRDKTIKGNGQIVTQVRTVHQFNGIYVSGLANVIVEQGDKNQVNISTDQNILPYMKTTVKNNQLYIGSQKNVSLNPSQAMNIIITSKSLNFSQISTAGKITFTAKNINSDSLSTKIGGETKMTLSGNVKNADFDLAGKSDVTLCDINATDINFNTAGESTIHLCGHGSNLMLKAAGKSDIDAKNFTVENLKVLGAGSINITSRVLKGINVTAFGKVHVNYYGSPKTIDKTAFGNVVLQKIGN